MTTPPRPHLEGQPTPTTGPDHAPPAPPRTAVGEPRGAARKGVRTALRSVLQTGTTGDPTPQRPGIRIYAPPVYRDHEDRARWSKRLGDTPTAAYACPCGHTATATGARPVAALVTEYDDHKHSCAGAPAALTEGRAAA
ncbi:hypothetical protein [Streptomyces broussonetiae]|uniref:Uncharacterized protein n=1 Tax=Streptomyces broussonetiae TaxID=2686304 RepID=A0ABV5EK11_9ACTN